jgi:cyclopropane fatty-acyl-phospholipid synthase-like methyltransferase
MQGYSQAAENNKAPIADIMGSHLQPDAFVLEIGSGAGQHALHMSNRFPGIIWLPSEREAVLPILRANLARYESNNVQPPLVLDLADFTWSGDRLDAVYAANVMHIVSERLGDRLVQLAADALKSSGLLMLYGPYKYNGQFTTESNATFDQWLKDRDPASGVRNFEAVVATAQCTGLTLTQDYAMPANNQMLIFERA